MANDAPDLPAVPSDWAAFDAALERALDLEDGARQAFLEGLDPDLSRALRDALAEDTMLDRRGDLIGSLGDPEATPDAAAFQGTRVGSWQVEGLIGEGGMGRVYRARRADGAYQQTAALKVVRQSLALAGADVSGRLRRERALLAGLEHPGIARLLDGGETPDGVPYLVTEFVDGQPITTYAQANDLGVAERVRLVAQTARAVDHAHRRFVVHRDLKPSNVLVAERDGATQPVVLDFGIAKLLDDAEDDGSGAFPLTRTGMRLLTPAYAAPELYEPTGSITAAADVYGLGALLYEMLTGQRPHGDGASGPPTTDPARPSKRVEDATGEASTQPTGATSRALRGDLDTICLRALHPEPDRRYASAADLADDLEATLDGRPIAARRDSAGYVAGRFVRRNRALVGTAAVALAALIGGLGFSLMSLANEREGPCPGRDPDRARRWHEPGHVSVLQPLHAWGRGPRRFRPRGALRLARGCR